MKYELIPMQKRLLDSVMAYAKENGLEVITKTIHFRDDDVPKFLEKLAKFEEESRKSKFIVGYSIAVKYA